MAIPPSVREFLEANQLPYRHHTHPQEFTSSRVAEALDKSGKAYAKTVVLVIDGELTLAAVPANERVDVEKLAQMAGASSARLADEPEFENAFPECELGAMPPFGDLYRMPVWLDASFERQPTIAFDGGTHTDTVEVSVEDFRRVVRPKVARLTEVGAGTVDPVVMSMPEEQRRASLTDLAPFVDDWAAATRRRPVTLELTRDDGSVTTERGAPLIAARVEASGDDAPLLEITLGDEAEGGHRITHRLPRVKLLDVELGQRERGEELVFESEGRGKAVLRVDARSNIETPET